MFKITPAAAEQIRASASQGGMENLALRIAAQRKPDGSIEYGLGFDETGDKDLHLNLEGIDIVIAPAHEELLNGAEMDFVEIEAGNFAFIFKNPNDPSYVPPQEE